VADEVIAGPAADVDTSTWLEQMQSWRQERRAAIRYQGFEYARPELAWTQRSFIQPQMMVEERYFYDPSTRRYTVDCYLDDLEKRYGGIDSVLIWPVYPNIGIDNRNQHDMLRAMPGGLAGVRAMIADFHRRGVRVLFPVMPWDAGSRLERVPLWEAVARDMKQIGADGINGDTMRGIGQEYRKASDESGHIIALEPENRMADGAMLAWNTMSWGYWKYQPVPVVSLYKWVEPRHMVNVCERWAKNRTDGLQAAFFNGVGYETWENVWGIWNQLTPRDAETVRRIALIERGVSELLASPDWQPHVSTLQRANGVYASRFTGPQQTLWLLVNRNKREMSGAQLRVPATTTMRYYDLWHGLELKPQIMGQVATLAFDIEGLGFGAVLAVAAPEKPGKLGALLHLMAQRTNIRPDSLSSEWKPLAQHIVNISPTTAAGETPEGMVSIPAGKFHFKVSGVEIEGSDPGVDFQYTWEDYPRRYHDREMEIAAFYIDKYPVTNAQFKKFLDASGYRPQDDYNFLKDWTNGAYRVGWDHKPVTWVAIEDARAYAAWAGKRLPHEGEWQYAAEGVDGRLYPWGNQSDATAIPNPEHGRELRGPSDVDAYPRGSSPFGVMDLVGNVWQWTDEYVDEHTRAAVLRGGSYYRPSGSNWYFPQNTRLDQHGKYLLMAPCKDRAGTLGFRCVMDR